MWADPVMAGFRYLFNIYIYGVRGVWIQLLGGGQWACARVILTLCECIWNVPVVLIVLPAFDDTSSLSSPPDQMVYPCV